MPGRWSSRGDNSYSDNSSSKRQSPEQRATHRCANQRALLLMHAHAIVPRPVRQRKGGMLANVRAAVAAIVSVGVSLFAHAEDVNKVVAFPACPEHALYPTPDPVSLVASKKPSRRDPRRFRA